MDRRAGGGPTQAGRHDSLRPIRHPVLPARLRLCRRHAVPLDGQRLLPDGRHRERHRQAASHPGLGQHAEHGDADLPQPVGPHRPRDAKGRRPQSPANSTRAQYRLNCRPRSPPCTAITRRRSRPGSDRASTCRRSSSWSATTLRPRNWSTNGSPGSSAKSRASSLTSSTASSSCSATTTTTTAASPDQTRC